MQTRLPSHTHVTVLRGGTSSEYPLSLETGGRVTGELQKDLSIQDVFIDTKDKWFVQGVEKKPEVILRTTDVVFNGLHGGKGEDGTLQRLLELHQLPYSGSRQFPSFLSLHKKESKKVFKAQGLRIPNSSYMTVHEPEKQARDLFSSSRLPLLFKLPASGSSHGVFVALSFDEIVSIMRANKGEELMVEEYIFGTPVSCGVVQNMRDKEFYELLPVEIRTGDEIYHHDKRREYEIKCPSHLPRSVKREIQETAKVAHKTLGLSHYSQSDFMVTQNGKVYLLETNALPSLASDTPFSLSLDAVGLDFNHFLHHILSLALEDK